VKLASRIFGATAPGGVGFLTKPPGFFCRRVGSLGASGTGFGGFGHRLGFQPLSSFVCDYSAGVSVRLGRQGLDSGVSGFALDFNACPCCCFQRLSLLLLLLFVCAICFNFLTTRYGKPIKIQKIANRQAKNIHHEANASTNIATAVSAAAKRPLPRAETPNFIDNSKGGPNKQTKNKTKKPFLYRGGNAFAETFFIGSPRMTRSGQQANNQHSQ